MKRFCFVLLLLLAALSRTGDASVIVIVTNPLLDDDTALLPLPCLEILQQANPFENVARPENEELTANLCSKYDLDEIAGEVERYLASDDPSPAECDFSPEKETASTEPGNSSNADEPKESSSLGVVDQLTTLLQMARMLCEEGQSAYQAVETFIVGVAVALPLGFSDAAVQLPRQRQEFDAPQAQDDFAAASFEGCPAESTHVADAGLSHLDSGDEYANSDDEYADLDDEYADSDDESMEADSAQKYGDNADDGDDAESGDNAKSGDDAESDDDGGSGDNVALWCCVSGEEYRYWTKDQYARKGDSPIFADTKIGTVPLAARLTQWAGQSLGNWNTAIQNILQQIAQPDWRTLLDGRTAAGEEREGFSEEDFVQ